jgi:Mrp family chromosome partitioning ATPase
VSQNEIVMSPSTERWAEGPALLTSVWRYKYLVLGVALVLGVLAYLVSQAQPNVYEASTRLYLTDPGNADVFGRNTGNRLERYLPQQTERISSTPVLAAAAEELGDGATPRSISRQIEVEGDIDAATVEIVVQDGSAQRAADVANAVADAYQAAVRDAQMERAQRASVELERAQEEIQEQIETLSEEADALPEDAPGAARIQSQIGVLTQRLIEMDTLIQQLRVDARLFGSGVEFVEEAQVPDSPVAPTPRRTAAGTAIFGFLVASAVAYWLAGRSTRIESKDQPSEVLGVPLLGTLPTYKVKDRSTLRERVKLDPRTAEAYRFAYSSLDHVLREAGARSVMITSAGPATGKTETALQLAITAAARGDDVLLVDGDLRMRGLTRLLGAERSPGLYDLARSSDGEQLPLVVGRYRFAPEHTLNAVTSGAVVGDGSELLRESWFGRAFRQLAAAHDRTFVDTPPLLAVADTATIASYADAVVLVIREGSEVHDLERVKHRLQFIGQRLVGYIYLSSSALDDTNFDYGLVRSQTWRSGGAPAPVLNPPSGRPAGTSSRDPAEQRSIASRQQRSTPASELWSDKRWGEREPRP